MRLRSVLVFLVLATPAAAQESKLHAELRREAERIAENCDTFDLRAIGSCVVTLATDKPLHVALGSIAPENGFGFGAAFVTRHNPSENWRLSWNADAVRALGGAWRAGAYMKVIRTAIDDIVVVSDPDETLEPAASGVHAYPVMNVYAQAISLPTLSYFGLGSDSSRDGRATFGMHQSIVGANTIVPMTQFGIGRALNLSLVGEINGRFVSVGRGPADEGPSIEEVYTEASAPGLGRDPGFLQLGEGVRIKPSLLNGRARLNYLLQVQQFIAPSDSTSSFRRWTIDLDHEFPLYRNSASPATRDTNGPDECAIDTGGERCPSITRNRTGAVGIRLLAAKSGVSGDSAVPFYFQQTLGGSDINGRRLLASYDDYRFRGPHLLAFQETLEHSVYGPIGVWLAAEQGKVVRQDEGLGDGGFRRSYGVGLTLRAGGFPAVLMSWARGDREGSHFAFTMTTTLLGGSSRPSLQ